MPQQRSLNRLVGALEQAGAEYMLTGSLVSSAQGNPRSTHDIDVVVELTAAVASRIVRAFPEPDFYADAMAAADAAHAGGMFNILDIAEADKIDVWALTEEPFDLSRFSRRVRLAIGDTTAWASAPEDTILMKLLWIARHGGGDRHLLDAIAVYEVQRPILDANYLDSWAKREGVAPLLARLRDQAKPIE